MATPSSESSTTPPIEESATKDESQPKSADVENETAEVSETPKKKKKELEAEKKEDQKNVDSQKVCKLWVVMIEWLYILC